MDEQGVRAVLRHYLDHSAAGREDVAHEIYHPTPSWSSRSRASGSTASRTSSRGAAEYPATRIDFDVRRVRGGGDAWVVELRIRYDGGPVNFGVEILEFRGDKVARETIYVMDGWEAPQWRSRWWAGPPTLEP